MATVKLVCYLLSFNLCLPRQFQFSSKIIRLCSQTFEQYFVLLMTEDKARKITKKVRFNEKIEVFLIPSEINEADQRLGVSGIDWIRFSRVKPLVRKPTEKKLRTAFTIRENIRRQHHQNREDLSDFAWQRNDKHELLGCGIKNPKQTPSWLHRLQIPRNVESSSGYTYYQRQVVPETFARGKCLRNSPVCALHKPITNMSPKFRAMIMGSNYRQQFSEILAIYGNNSTTTTKAEFLEPRHVAPQTTNMSEHKKRGTSADHKLPYLIRTAPITCTVHSAYSVPSRRDLTEDNIISWKWLYLT